MSASQPTALAEALRNAHALLRSLAGQFPGDVNCLWLLGAALLDQDKIPEIIVTLEAVLAGAPDFANARVDLARAYRSSGQASRARTEVRRVLEKTPRHHLAWLAYGDALVDLEQYPDARVAFERARLCDPQRQQVEAATAALVTDDRETSERTFRDILRADPSHVAALCGLAALSLTADKPDDAERLLRHALKQSASIPLAWRGLVQALMALGRLREAEAAARRLLKIEPENPHSWITIAAVATRLLRQEEALEAYQQAARLKPEEVQLQMSIGHVHKTLGRRAESEAAYKAALAMAPGTAEAYWSLADLKNYSFSDSELAAMRQLLDHTGVERASAAQLHFALGKAFEQRQQYAGAFSHYARGNALRRLVERRTARIRAFFARLAGSGDQSAAPIFIVGLPRSGSTLVEQILASHSRVEGTMELPNIISITHQFDDLLASRYLQETAALRTGCERFTDKLPHNFSHLARKPIRNSAQCPSGALHEAAIRLFFLLGGALLNQSLGWLFLGFFLAIHALAHVDCSWIVHC